MSIVAISETAGSLGIEIGRKLAESLGWEFADREIIAKASEQFGEDVMDLRQGARPRSCCARSRTWCACVRRPPRARARNAWSTSRG